MILAWLLLLTGLTLSSVAIYYSVEGLTAIFSAAAIPIMIMGVSLEVAKLVCATWIKQYWTEVPRLMKTYMVTAVVILMLITSMGIFGFLSKAHNDQNLVSGDVGARLAIYDEKIKTAKDNIDINRKALRQMDEAVDQVMGRSTDEKGADKAVAIRRGQAKDRARLQQEITTEQKIISALNNEAAPIRAENRKVEAEVGPIKYIAAFLYGVEPDATMLEKAVTWIIITIVVVFDPLAVIMLLAAQMTFGWHSTKDREQKTREERIQDLVKDITDQNRHPQYLEPDVDFNEVNKKLRAAEEPPLTEIPLPPEPFQSGPFVSGTFHQAKYQQDDGPLTETQVEQIQAIAKEELPTGELIAKEELFLEPTIQELVSDVGEKPTADEIQEPPPPVRVREAMPGLNRGVINSHTIVEADNTPTPAGRASNSGFGNEFPSTAEKGDVHLRTDFLPNRLFKFNGIKWLEVDKTQIGVYAYEEEYIKYLIEQIDEGKYDTDLLTDVEREQIQQYLGRNA